MKRAALLAAITVAVLQITALFNPDVPLIDCEERYNAAHALELVRGHPEALLRLQYRPFCGGCSLVSGLGALLFAVAEPSFFVWKLVAIGFSVLMTGAGVLGLARTVGPAAAAAFALLCVFAPWAYIHLSLLSWGNHTECGVLALLMLLLDEGRSRRSGRTGLLGGFGLWVGFSMGFAVLGLGLARLRDPSASLRYWSGVALGAGPLWLAQRVSTGAHPFGTIYVPGERVPDITRIGEKLWTLIAPGQLAALFGLPRWELGVFLGVGWAVAAVVAAFVAREALARRAAQLVALWCAVYLVVGFRLEPSQAPQVSAPAAMRYFAAVYPMLFVVLASAMGGLWTVGRRGAALSLGAIPLLAGGLARAATVSAPFPDRAALEFRAADHGFFRDQASYLLRPDEHGACESTAVASRALHAFSAGRAAVIDRRELAEEGAPRAYWEGVGSAEIDARDPRREAALGVLMGIWEDVAAARGSAAAQVAFSAALWRRVYSQERWGLGRGGLTPGALRRIVEQLGPVDPDVRAAVLRSLGRRWARVQARWAQPAVLAFPALPPDDAGAFAAGFGHGLGEEWGSRVEIPRPRGLPEGVGERLRAGYVAGVAQGWLLASDSPRLVDGGRDAEADRWWGPAPPRHCVCNATCE